MKTLRVEQLDAETWEVYVNGGQTGQYPTLPAAKAAARRRCHSLTRRLEWRELPGPAVVWQAEATL